jgi:hypothetical protein
MHPSFITRAVTVRRSTESRWVSHLAFRRRGPREQGHRRGAVRKANLEGIRLTQTLLGPVPEARGRAPEGEEVCEDLPESGGFLRNFATENPRPRQGGDAATNHGDRRGPAADADRPPRVPEQSLGRLLLALRSIGGGPRGSGRARGRRPHPHGGGGRGAVQPGAGEGRGGSTAPSTDCAVSGGRALSDGGRATEAARRSTGAPKVTGAGPLAERKGRALPRRGERLTHSAESIGANPRSSCRGPTRAFIMESRGHGFRDLWSTRTIGRMAGSLPVAPGSQSGYIKASNTAENAHFGASLCVSGDGATLVVGAPGERSSATGIDGDQTNISLRIAGAAYVFAGPGRPGALLRT